MSQDFRLPDLGEGVHEGQIVRVFVKEGDYITEDQPLLEVETDKAAVEIPSPFTGTVSVVHVQEHQLVHVGDTMVSFTAVEGARPVEEKKREASRGAPGTTGAAGGASAVAAAPPPTVPHRITPASPAVRRLARELGIELSAIAGSGPAGRVTRQDVETAADRAAAPVPSRSSAAAPAPAARPRVGQGRRSATPPPAALIPPGTDDRDQYGAIRRQPLTQARKTIARVMSTSWSTIPHVTDSHDADVTDLDRLRRGYRWAEQPERKLTLLPFVIRGVVRALANFPQFNASFDEAAEQIIFRRYVNVGIGVHTERGLVAPVLRDADRLSVIQIADQLELIAEKAHTASFAVDDTRGGTYTISNPGAIGTTRYSTPLITPPQVAVLALGRAQWQPRVVDGQIVPRLVLPLSHSFDHRIIDGGDEIAFMNHLVQDLEHPAQLLLD